LSCWEGVNSGVGSGRVEHVIEGLR
jgi:hypothetical protein